MSASSASGRSETRIWSFLYNITCDSCRFPRPLQPQQLLQSRSLQRPRQQPQGFGFQSVNQGLQAYWQHHPSQHTLALCMLSSASSKSRDFVWSVLLFFCWRISPNTPSGAQTEYSNKLVFADYCPASGMSEAPNRSVSQ